MSPSTQTIKFTGEHTVLSDRSASTTSLFSTWMLRNRKHERDRNLCAKARLKPQQMNYFTLRHGSVAGI